MSVVFNLSFFEAMQLLPGRVVKRAKRKRPKAIRHVNMDITCISDDEFVIRGDADEMVQLQKRLDIINESLDFRYQVNKVYEENNPT